MISFLMGEIRNIRLDPCVVVIVSAGVGYEVSLPVFVYESLNIDGLKPGKHIELEIYYHVTERQPKPVLVGFRHPAERNFFEQLIEVEGIGPTKAASALVFPVSTIAAAIEMEDLSVLQQLPGIGNRAAQKIVATLKGKVSETALLKDRLDVDSDNLSGQISVRTEAIEALLTLGYRSNEAMSKVEGAFDTISDDPETVEDILREVFKSQINHNDKP